jgi:hypothetical protein
MRTKPYELQAVGFGLAVDQDQVGLDVAVPVIVPLAFERVVDILPVERLIHRQSPNDRPQILL